MENKLKQSNIFIAEMQCALREFNQSYENSNARLQEIKAGIEKLPEKVLSFHHDFDIATKLTNTDIAFIIIGIALREIASLLFKSFKINRINDQDSAKLLHGKEKSNRTQEYFASINEIISNPVPYDAICSTDLEIKKEVKLSGFGHRFNTVGHDPILGFIFGTANIMTNTITVSKGVKGIIPSYSTYHVGTFGKDKLYGRADTATMFYKIYERISQDPKEGFTAFGTALIKELIHLLSDVRTAKSLPLPFVGTISPDISRKMQLYLGIDTLVVSSNIVEFFTSQLIDKGLLIARDFWWRYVEREKVMRNV